MGADGVKATLVGLPDLRATLLSIPDKMRKKVLRQALREGALIVRTAARAAAPVLERPTPFRTAGTLRKAISIRASKASTRAGAVGVFVNVRPLKKAQRGAKNPKDPFYWRWINWGWHPRAGKRGAFNLTGKGDLKRVPMRSAKGKVAGKKFLEAGASVLGAALDQIENYLSARVQAMNNIGAKL